MTQMTPFVKDDDVSNSDLSDAMDDEPVIPRERAAEGGRRAAAKVGRAGSRLVYWVT